MLLLLLLIKKGSKRMSLLLFYSWSCSHRDRKTLSSSPALCKNYDVVNVIKASENFTSRLVSCCFIWRGWFFYKYFRQTFLLEWINEIFLVKRTAESPSSSPHSGEERRDGQATEREKCLFIKNVLYAKRFCFTFIDFYPGANPTKSF